MGQLLQSVPQMQPGVIYRETRTTSVEQGFATTVYQTLFDSGDIQIRMSPGIDPGENNIAPFARFPDPAWQPGPLMTYSSSSNQRYIMPAIAAPIIGATQNIHNCAIAQPCTINAGPVLRAGLTDVLVTGMLIR